MTLLVCFQTMYLLVCFSITWIPIAGALFPLVIMLLVPVRQYIFSKLFKGAHLTDLDAVEYKELPTITFNMQTEVNIGNTGVMPSELMAGECQQLMAGDSVVVPGYQRNATILEFVN
ncbi:putative boron transporter 2 [Canna indica]|uniref:Boron transporter 2 n=1 Tax=Canna indica TaxID=4628 RepID=A0AAQ3KAK5_9LILI|nr:putative boron transporter 2 [Canna indica]